MRVTTRTLRRLEMRLTLSLGSPSRSHTLQLSVRATCCECSCAEELELFSARLRNSLYPLLCQLILNRHYSQSFLGWLVTLRPRWAAQVIDQAP